MAGPGGGRCWAAGRIGGVSAAAIRSANLWSNQIVLDVEGFQHCRTAVRGALNFM